MADRFYSPMKKGSGVFSREGESRRQTGPTIRGKRLPTPYRPREGVEKKTPDPSPVEAGVEKKTPDP
jgi:hypothetical protein